MINMISIPINDKCKNNETYEEISCDNLFCTLVIQSIETTDEVDTGT